MPSLVVQRYGRAIDAESRYVSRDFELPHLLFGNDPLNPRFVTAGGAIVVINFAIKK